MDIMYLKQRASVAWKYLSVRTSPTANCDVQCRNNGFHVVLVMGWKLWRRSGEDNDCSILLL